MNRFDRYDNDKYLSVGIRDDFLSMQRNIRGLGDHRLSMEVGRVFID